MDSESIFELQKLDCNCNNCIFFKRDRDKTFALNTNPHIVANKIHYGICERFNKEVGEIANILLLHTQHCFVHRKTPETAIIQGLSRRKINKQVKKKIFHRDGKCLKCGLLFSWEFTLDHIVPLSKGGTNEEFNLQTLCDNCNRDKGSQIIDYRSEKVKAMYK